MGLLKVPQVFVIKKVLTPQRRGVITVELRVPADDVCLLAGVPDESLYPGALVPVTPFEHPAFQSLSEQGKVWKNTPE